MNNNKIKILFEDIDQYLSYVNNVKFPLKIEWSGPFSGFPMNYNNSISSSLDVLVNNAEKNEVSLPFDQVGESHVDGDTVIYHQVESGFKLNMPINDYKKKIWFFHLLSRDFWDKYPSKVKVKKPPLVSNVFSAGKQRVFETDEEYKSHQYDQLKQATQTALKNIPEAQEAQEMIEAKKEEGTYWSEMERVVEEYDRLEKLAKEVENENK